MKLNKTLIGILVLLLIWQIISLLKIFSPIFFASPLEVIKESILMLQQNSFYLDIFATLYRVVISLIVATVIGVPLGLLLGYFSKVYLYVGEIIDFFRSVPPIVIYPLLLISLGPGDSSRIGTAIFGSIAIIILIVSKGLSQQDNVRQIFFKSRGATSFQILKEIVWYEALPHIMTALRTAASISLIVIVVTEMLVGGRYGLGARVQQVQVTSNIPDLFFTIIIIGLIGILLNKIFLFIDKKIVTWKT